MSPLVFCFSIQSVAQSYAGFNVDRYAGVHGISLNPTRATGSAYRIDFSIISGSAYLATDYLVLDIQSVLKGG